jgi:rhodanese-related sulfurtransferase
MKTINTQDLHDKLETSTIALFDVRGDVKFEQGHIPDSMTAPLGSLVFRVVRVMNPESYVVVYSDGGDCDLSRQAVTRLENLGMKNVHCYEDGLSGWAEAGFEVRASKHAKLHTQGPVLDVRPLVVDRDKAYGGAFKGKPTSTEAAGG